MRIWNDVFQKFYGVIDKNEKRIEYSKFIQDF